MRPGVVAAHLWRTRLVRQDARMADALANIADPGPQPGSAEVFANDALAATQDGTAGAAADAAGATVSPIVADSAADAEERRRHPRAPVDLLVGLKFDTVQQFLAVYAEDISESGMFLRSEHAGAVREVGQVLDLRFDAGQQRIVQAMNRAGYLRPESKVVCSNVGAAFAATDH